MQWQIETIINVANSLQQHGSSSGSTGEVIAAADLQQLNESVHQRDRT